VDDGRNWPVSAVKRTWNTSEVAQDVFCDAVGELVSVGAVGEQAAKRADDRVDGLAAKGWQAVDDCDFASKPRGLQGCRHAGDPCTDHADVGADLLHRLVGAMYDPCVGLGCTLLRHPHGLSSTLSMAICQPRPTCM